ncbi:ORF1a [Feline astrovirus D1]|uniref:ORF1a n=1 Tax=Feline astrovirus D1 TaxID=1538452 RepID=A0A076JZA6_9VIRU|nr:ORF1a [Feline astrovirus D1]AII82239.1 ORF1a [Feline astrovirus D1]
MHINDPYDAVLSFGSPGARRRGLQLNLLSKDKLEDIFGDGGPLCFEFHDISVVDSSSGTVMPTSKKVKTIAVSGVCDGNQYVTYAFVPGANTWCEIDPKVHRPTALVGVLRGDHARLNLENQDLKRQISSLKLELELQRHEHARLQQQLPPKFRKFNVWKWLIYSMLLGMLFISSCKAERYGKCLDLELSDTSAPQACVHWVWDRPDEQQTRVEGIKIWLQEVKLKIANAWHQSGAPQFVKNAWIYAVDWHVLATVIGLVYVLYAERPAYMLATLVLATLSKVQLFALSALPSLDVVSTITLWISMVVYVFDQPMAILTSVFLAVTASVACVAMPDYGYSQVIRGAFVVVATIIASHVAHITHAPNWLCVMVLVLYRIMRVTTYILAEKVEIKGPDGKVQEVKYAHPSWITKVSKVLNPFNQKVRTGISPTARVIPNGVVVVDTKEGTGTGFRLRSYIVTAAHVVGNEETVRIVWGGVQAFTKVIYKHPQKDVAYLTLPQECQELPTYKLAKKVEDGPVVITSLDDGGVLAVSVSEGVVVGSNMTYAVHTKNGMSGSPVTNVDGRILGVHQTNTGFTGGAVIITNDDFPQPKKNVREAELEEKIKNLEAALAAHSQNSSVNDIVDLVRAAVSREMQILRQELVNETFVQAKGKTKAKRRLMGYRGRKLRKAFTEEEYKDLLEKGFTKEQLRNMADAIREAMEYGDDDEVEDAYPDWSDHDSDDEIEKEWFGQSAWTECEPIKEDVLADTLPIHLRDKYGLDYYLITEFEARQFAKELADYREHLEAVIRANVEKNKWVQNVDTRAILEDLNTMWYNLNHLFWKNGLIPFTQRKKQKPKNLKRGPKGPQ